MHQHIVTYQAYRVGRPRFLIVACLEDKRVWIAVKLDADGSVDSLEARFTPPSNVLNVPVPFASVPPVVRAMVRGLAEATLWELVLQGAVKR